MDKKIKYLMMFAAIAALAPGLTACSSEDDLASNEQQRGVVKTEFTISFPQNLRGQTRQTTVVVQGQMDNNQQVPIFRGIESFSFYAFDEKVSSIQSSPSSVSLGSSIQLALQGNTIAISGLSGVSKSHLYENVEIPIETQTFMFYGLAKKDGTSKFANGDLTDNLNTANIKLDGIRFEPKSILESQNLNDAVPTDGSKIARYMTKIAQSAGWSDSKTVTLKTLYTKFTSITSGSWTNVKAAVQELYNSVYDRTDDVSAAIKNSIINTKTSDDDSATENYVSSSSEKKLTFITIGDETSGAYPRNFGLPDGAAQISFNSTSKEFSALTATNNFGFNIAKLTDYAYPASLFYRALSPLYVSTESKKTSYDNTNASWDAILEAYKKPDNTYDQIVKEDTRSIAMVDKVQYAVGRLDITVKATDFSLLDSNGEAVTATGENIKLTGVLIGGQTPVDYQFMPIIDANGKATGNEYTLYDREINVNIFLTTSKSAINHTLTLETPHAKSDDDKIKVALEFENNTNKVFVGKANALIYPGCKFYMLGELDALTNKKTVGEETIDQVFKQDYVTTVNFEIKSLKQAYGVLPDLRAPKLELGLSVDLNWKSGITQDITIE